MASGCTVTALVCKVNTMKIIRKWTITRDEEPKLKEPQLEDGRITMQVDARSFQIASEMRKQIPCLQKVSNKGQRIFFRGGLQ